MNSVVHKSAAYITCGDWILVFSQPDSPGAGIQIPSGTVEAEEDPAVTVLREAEEETGLTDLRIEQFLGTRVYDMRPITGAEVDLHRHFFHLVYPGPIGRVKWRHWERAPSGGAVGPIEFELFWVQYPDGVPELTAGLGDLLGDLKLSE